MYRVSESNKSWNFQAELDDSLAMIDKSLLADLDGWRRRLWRRRIRCAIFFRAAVAARDIRSPRWAALLRRSLWEWPSPAFLPKRWKMLAASPAAVFQGWPGGVHNS